MGAFSILLQMPVHVADPDHLDALAQRAAAGERQAFHELALAVEPAVRITIAAHAPHPHLVEEMVQATLVRTYQRLSTYRGGGTFVAWIRAIARNELRMELRSHRRDQPISEDLDAVLISAQLDVLEDEEAAAEREKSLDRLRNCLHRLPPQVRRLVEAHHLEGRPVAFLAKQMKRTANWVAVTLFRARRGLAECIQAETGGHHGF